MWPPWSEGIGAKTISAICRPNRGDAVQTVSLGGERSGGKAALPRSGISGMGRVSTDLKDQTTAIPGGITADTIVKEQGTGQPPLQATPSRPVWSEHPGQSASAITEDAAAIAVSETASAFCIAVGTAPTEAEAAKENAAERTRIRTLIMAPIYDCAPGKGQDPPQSPWSESTPHPETAAKCRIALIFSEPGRFLTTDQLPHSAVRPDITVCGQAFGMIPQNLEHATIGHPVTTAFRDHPFQFLSSRPPTNFP